MLLNTTGQLSNFTGLTLIPEEAAQYGNKYLIQDLRETVLIPVVPLLCVYAVGRYVTSTEELNLFYTPISPFMKES